VDQVIIIKNFSF